VIRCRTTTEEERGWAVADYTVEDIKALLEVERAKVGELQGILIDNTHALRTVLHGSSTAMSCTPKEAWELTLAEVVSLREQLADAQAELLHQATGHMNYVASLDAQLEQARTALTERDRALRTIMAWRPGDHGAERFKPWEIAAAALSEEPTNG
jgi:hypothetical protein